jgi:hypothetical protein
MLGDNAMGILVLTVDPDHAVPGPGSASIEQMASVLVGSETTDNAFQRGADQVLSGDVKGVAMSLPDRVMGAAQAARRGWVTAMEARTHTRDCSNFA